MWTVIKYKSNNYNLMKKSLRERHGSLVEFYRPELIYTKKIKNKDKKFCIPLLKNYVFCYLKEFRDTKIVSSCKNIVGVEYFLKGIILIKRNFKFYKFLQKTRIQMVGYYLIFSIILR